MSATPAARDLRQSGSARPSSMDRVPSSSCLTWTLGPDNLRERPVVHRENLRYLAMAPPEGRRLRDDGIRPARQELRSLIAPMRRRMVATTVPRAPSPISKTVIATITARFEARRGLRERRLDHRGDGVRGVLVGGSCVVVKSDRHSCAARHGQPRRGLPWRFPSETCGCGPRNSRALPCPGIGRRGEVGPPGSRRKAPR